MKYAVAKFDDTANSKKNPLPSRAGAKTFYECIMIFILLMAVCLLLPACSSNLPSKEKVSASLKSIMPPDFEIVSISPVKDIRGLIEVSVKMNKQPVVLYMDKKARYVFSGSLLEIATKRNLTIEAQGRIKQ